MSYNASALAPNITRAVRALKEEYPNAPLYVAGHSMGAAMAHICALDMKFTLGFDNINVYTYGSPRVGNDKFKGFFNNIVNVSLGLVSAFAALSLSCAILPWLGLPATTAQMLTTMASLLLKLYDRYHGIHTLIDAWLAFVALARIADVLSHHQCSTGHKMKDK